MAVKENRIGAPDNLELVGKVFRFIDSRPYDDKNRVSLGKRVFDLLKELGSFDSFRVYLSEEGYLLLTPMAHIPANEMWIWQDEDIRESFRKALEDAREGRVKKIDDLDSFLGTQ
jgi:hypothetical protein